MPLRILLSVALAAAAADAPAADHLAPLDFLVGHCWEGELEPGMRNAHCFERAGDGSIRDRHEVRRGGSVIYGGETVYRWQTDSGTIGFRYHSGGRIVGEGRVRAISGGLDFGAVDYAAGTGTVRVSSRWMRVGSDSYDAIDEAQSAPRFNKTIRYTRVQKIQSR